MKKLQQFKVYAFTYERLALAKFKVNTNPFEAELRGEVVSLGDNECLRAIRRIRNREFVPEELQALLDEKLWITRQNNSTENKSRIKEINNAVREMLFVPEIISVHTPKKRNYTKIGRDGFFVNGVHYQRFICGAGHARTNRTLFVSSDIYKELESILSLGLEDVTIIPAKWNAYFALTSSATYRVSSPRAVVIPDKEVVLRKTVDFVEEDDFQDKVTRQERDLKINLFDGQGIVCPRMAEKWSNELELGYVSGVFGVRAPFIKGMLCTMDFHKFAEEVAHTDKIKDLWGNTYNINDVDVIISESQFKLWSSFSCWEEYVEKMEESKIKWGLSKAMPDYEHEKNYYRSNYQFLQVLDKDKLDIEGLCSQTVDWFSGISGNDYNKNLLYMLGKLVKKFPYYQVFDKCNSPIIKSFMLDNRLMGDSYIQDSISRSIQKKQKEACLGKIILSGNFQCTVSDPYGQLEHAFGLEVKGLLGEHQGYSNYWNHKGIDKIASQRAPLTWKSEVVIFELLQNEMTDKWYKYLTSGLVFNIYGVEAMLSGGADFDTDECATTSNIYLINSRFLNVAGIPVTYTPQKAKKVKLDKENLWAVDMLGYEQKIGKITNTGSTFPEMQSMFPTDSREWQELDTRWKLVCKLQSVEIDSQKGLEKKPIFKHWLNYNKLTDEQRENMSSEELEKIDFNNKLVIEKRPYFMRYLYPKYNAEYKAHVADFDRYCLTKYDCKYKELPEEFKQTEEYEELKEYYDRKNPLLETYGTMNRICYYMEDAIKNIKHTRKMTDNLELFEILSSGGEVDNGKLSAMTAIYDEYVAFKRSKMLTNSEFSTYEQYYKYLRNKSLETISSDIGELADLAVILCYKNGKKKEFCWDVFGQGIVNNLLEKKLKSGNPIVMVPQLDENGSIDYLGEKYSMQPVNLAQEEPINEVDFDDEGLFDPFDDEEIGGIDNDNF